MSETKGARLRALFNNSSTTLVPFGTLPLHAQMAEAAGFEMFEVSGGMSAWWEFGVADVGHVTLTEVVDQARRVARSVDIPVYCDADTGYGAPLNVQRTVREFIDAGVAGIHIEDQREPKKAGGQPGIALVSDAEAIGRLNAAVEARDKYDPDFVLVARTDGYGATGGSFEEAIRRGKLYREETGVDVIFYEGFHTWEQIRMALTETPGPAYAIPAPSIETRPSIEELSAMGQSIDILPFILPGVHEVWRLLLEVKEAGNYTPMDAYIRSVQDAAGTKFDVGWGDPFGRPSYEEARRTEDAFLPAELRRDYINNVNT